MSAEGLHGAFADAKGAGRNNAQRETDGTELLGGFEVGGGNGWVVHNTRRRWEECCLFCPWEKSIYIGMLLSFVMLHQLVNTRGTLTVVSFPISLRNCI